MNIVETICIGLLTVNTVIRIIIYCVCFFEDIQIITFLIISDTVSLISLIMLFISKCTLKTKVVKKPKRRKRRKTSIPIPSVTYERYDEPDAVIRYSNNLTRPKSNASVLETVVNVFPEKRA